MIKWDIRTVEFTEISAHYLNFWLIAVLCDMAFAVDSCTGGIQTSMFASSLFSSSTTVSVEATPSHTSLS